MSTEHFPPHWFIMSKSGLSIHFSMVPCGSASIQSTQWRLFPDGLRALDLAELVPMLATVPDHHALVICYVDTIDTAHYLMECCRTVLACYTEEDRKKLFGPEKPPFAPDAQAPTEPLPAGHADSFSMDHLRDELEKMGPTP